MHCNGKRQRMKKLKQEANKDSQNPDRKNEIKINLLFFSQIKQPHTFSLGSSGNAFSEFQHQLTKDIAADFFHPPSIA